MGRDVPGVTAGVGALLEGAELLWRECRELDDDDSSGIEIRWRGRQSLPLERSSELVVC